ncbi:MAG: porin family protein [Acidobacteria bacterium]|nr:porin family protein [Acidobacteriota bacterium]
MSLLLRTTALTLAALGLASTQVRAEDPRFGVQASANIPNGDLKDAVDNKLGVGGGAHFTFDLGDGHMVRPRIDYIFFPEATISAIRNKVNELSLGADYLYFLEGKPLGLYFTGGLSFNRWKADVTKAGVTSSDSSSKPGFALGAGYNFNASFGAEVRFTGSKYSVGSKDFSANALQAGVTLRF